MDRDGPLTERQAVTALSLSATEPLIATGEGWRAEIDFGVILLYVDPTDDGLATAVETLISAPLRRFWTVTFAGETPDGKVMYLLKRTQPEPC